MTETGLDAGPSWPANTLMARLAPPVRERLLGLADAEDQMAGRVLIRQGDDTTSDVFLLRSAWPGSSACVKVSSTLENGDECLLGISVSGDIVGELTTIRDGAPRSATVTTCSRSLVHRIPHGAFTRFLEQNSDAWSAVSLMISDRLDWANRRRLDFVSYDVETRLARVLVELADRHGYRGVDGYELGVLLSQEELGKLISAKADTVRHAMGRLKEKGLVTTKYRHVIIADMAGMRTHAEMRRP